jgi:hypothetical protein
MKQGLFAWVGPPVGNLILTYPVENRGEFYDELQSIVRTKARGWILRLGEINSQQVTYLAETEMQSQIR